MTAILGISGLYHDSAAALVVDGRIVAAAQEERFTGKKHDESFPISAIRACLAEGGLEAADLDYVGFYEKPLLKFDRLVETYLAYAPRGYRSFAKAMGSWLDRKQNVPREIRAALGDLDSRVVFTQHHESHAASAFFPSPFDEAAILTLDGVGEWSTASLGVGRGNRIELREGLRFPHSLGLLYTAFTYYTGFEVNSGEYKLMGLAPYGVPRFADLILEELLDLKQDGSFRLDMSYFDYCKGLTMTSKKFEALFGGPARDPRDPAARITQREMDLAASIQWVTEEVMLRLARHLHESTGLDDLCLAGGVALNCVGNGRILREGPFRKLWIQPAAGDAGGALGVALFIWHQLLGNERTAQPSDFQQGSLLGHAYADAEIGAFLDGVGASYEHYTTDAELCERIADELASRRVVGWFQGRMEFGPRALGARSILADARESDMQSTINRKVKFREGFRPFAPVVLREHASEWFDVDADYDNPYMLVVAPVRAEKCLPVSEHGAALEGTARLGLERSEIPAVTHVDGSARVQTVDRERHGVFRELLEAFHARTGCPVLVNTSFNLGWDPIVCTPRDAYRTFMSSHIDVLALGRYVLTKPKRADGMRLLAEEDERDALDDKLASPCCAAELRRRKDTLTCTSCAHAFAIEDGIPLLYWPHETVGESGDVTDRVKSFYEQTPFPNYDEHDSVRSLIEKSRQGLYARRLDETIPYESDVLEVGCGTGQLSNFLGIANRRVVGADLCLDSLRLGEAFRRQHDLSRVRFVQMNLFRPVFRPEQFDVLVCNGVLHHTSDPRGALEQLIPVVKRGGYLIVGLYNRWGRLFTDLRRRLFRLTGGRARSIDPVLRGGVGEAKERAWFADQYLHPHESKHSMGGVLRWFDELGLEFVRGVPALRPQDDGLAGESLFEPQPRGSPLDRFAVQASEVVAAGQKEGGFFVMIGRRQ